MILGQGTLPDDGASCSGAGSREASTQIKEQLVDFIVALDVATTRDDTIFFIPLLVYGVGLLGLNDRFVAEKCHTAPGTVSRWRNGYSKPASCTGVYRFLRNKAKLMLVKC
jgi:hypothetical protein